MIDPKIRKATPYYCYERIIDDEKSTMTQIRQFIHSLTRSWNEWLYAKGYHVSGACMWCWDTAWERRAVRTRNSSIQGGERETLTHSGGGEERLPGAAGERGTECAGPGQRRMGSRGPGQGAGRPLAKNKNTHTQKIKQLRVEKWMAKFCCQARILIQCRSPL